MQKNQFFFIISLIFSGIVAFFALINGSPVSVDLFFVKLEASLALVVLASAILGAIIVSLLGLAKHIKMKMEIKKLVKENQELTRKNLELTIQVREVSDAAAAKNLADEQRLADLEASKTAMEVEAARSGE